MTQTTELWIITQQERDYFLNRLESTNSLYSQLENLTFERGHFEDLFITSEEYEVLYQLQEKSFG